MSARDDYPLGRLDTGVVYTVDPAVWHALCDELDVLRARVEVAERDAREWKRTTIRHRATIEAVSAATNEYVRGVLEPLANMCEIDWTDLHERGLVEYGADIAGTIANLPNYALADIVADGFKALRVAVGSRSTGEET